MAPVTKIITEETTLMELFQQYGGSFTPTSCIVTLDDKIIVYTKLATTVAKVGQVFKILTLVDGG